MSQSIAPAHVAHLLPGFVVNTLAPDERRLVLAHLTDCPACRAELAAWRAIGDALSASLPEQPADDATLGEVWRRVDATAQTGSSLRFNRRPGNGPAAGPAPVGLAPRRHDATGAAVTAAPERAAQPWAVTAARPARPLRALAIAALVALALGLGAIAFGPGWPRPGDPVQHLAAPESAPGPGEIAQEALLEVVVPAAYVPAWDRAEVAFELNTIPAGNTSTWDKPALRVEFVLEGEYRVRSEGPSTLIRRGAAVAEDVPPGAELVMLPGNALIASAETVSQYATDASTQVQILNWVLVEGPSSSPPRPWSWLNSAFDHREEVRLGSEALTMRWLRLDLGPDASLAAPDDQLQLVVQANVLEATIAMTGDGARRNIGETTATLYSSTVSPSGTGTLMP